MGRDGRSRSRERRDDRDRRDRSRDRRDDKKERSRDRDRDDKKSAEKKEKEDAEQDVFKPGRSVIVNGLQKNPEKNGSLGVLVEFNKEKGRWVVEFSSGNNNFKEENLELMPDNSDVIDEKEEPPTNKIYITGLAAEVTQEDLLKLFGGVGLIAKEKPKSSRDRGFEDQWPYACKLYKPGRKDGDAVLEFSDACAAKAAIKTYNRYKFKGSRIGVSYAGQGKVYEKTELQLPWHMREENIGKMDKDGPAGGAKPERKPGDWKCEGCGADVFASKDSCFKCGAPKPGGGGGGGGKDSGGKDSGKGGGYDRGGGKDGGKGKGKW